MTLLLSLIYVKKLLEWISGIIIFENLLMIVIFQLKITNLKHFFLLETTLLT